MLRSDIFRIAAESHLDPRTVQAVLDGISNRMASREAVRRAAMSLGIHIDLPEIDNNPPIVKAT